MAKKWEADKPSPGKGSTPKPTPKKETPQQKWDKGVGHKERKDK